MTAYLDASVLVPLVVPESSSIRVELFLKRDPGPLFVSEFGATEAASAVSRLVRMEQISIAAAYVALDAFDDWRLTVAEAVDITRADFRLAHTLVRQFETKLKAPDALHIAVATRLGARLISRDAGMLMSASMTGLVIVNPDQV